MSESGELGLNDHHQEQLIQFLRFSRYQRTQRLRAVESVFKETKNIRLNDTTYTKDEVTELLEHLETVLRAEFESELINSAHTGLLLLRQLCVQAEKWHLNLFANLSELENRELLDAVQKFEHHQFDSIGKRPPITVLRKLEPIESLGMASLLQTEIERLRVENECLDRQLKSILASGVDVNKEKEKLRSELEKVSNMGPIVKIIERENTTAVEQLSFRLTEFSGKMQEEKETSRKIQHKLEVDLTEMQRRLLVVGQQLEMKEAELDKEFSQTATYRNLKQMLAKKNEQIREMRAKLSDYQPTVLDEDEDD